MVAPFWTFAGKRLTKRFTAGTTKSVAQMTDNGWPDSSTFLLFLQHFKAHMVGVGLSKALLIMDNNSINLDPTCRLFCLNNHIAMLTLPANTTHKMQPLDVGFFGPLDKVVRKMAADEFTILNESNVARYVELAYEQFAKASPHIMVSAFRKAGI
jgi:hypothetical protein